MAGGAGWSGPISLNATIDGDTAAGPIAGYNTAAGQQIATSPQVTYTHSTPQNRVRGLQLDNQGGGDLSDFDGLGTFTADFYAGVTLLATLATSGANGGAHQYLLLPNGQELSGVTSVVIRALGKLNAGATVAPLWRELQLLEISSVYPCRRRNGTLEWYDVNGNLVPSNTVTSCGPCVPMTVSDLSLTGVSFNFAGDGSGADEYLSIVPLASSTAVGTVLVAPNHYHASAPSTNSTCGGKNVRVTFLPASSFDVTYGGVGGSSVGGAFIQFSAPSLGGALNFGSWASGAFTPGQSRVITIPNGKATLTYVSGPAIGNNAPRGVAAQCGLGAVGSSIIGLHLQDISTLDQPFVFRLDLERCS